MEENLYRQFCALQMSDLEDRLLAAKDPQEKNFWRALLDLKLQIAQEKLIFESLS